MKTYMFQWNGRRKFIDAESLSEAREKFMERFGFYPDSDTVIVMELKD